MPYQRKLTPLDPCPVETVIAMIGGKWKARILWQLSLESHSFAELRRTLGQVKQQVLAMQLASLANDGIIDCQQTVNGNSRSSVYSLTSLGRSLMPVLDSMATWGLDQVRDRGLDWVPPGSFAKSR
jgi:DNA-binding HxlR family transcriptional regulator